MNLHPSLGLPVVHLVDDEDVVRDALCWLLRSRRLLSEGHGSAEAFESWFDGKCRGGAAAWPTSPSWLLLDMRMPGMSDLVLFKRLIKRGLLLRLPAIFLTCQGHVPAAVAAVKRGAFDFIERPFSNNTLVDRVEQALERSAQAMWHRGTRDETARALAELTERERDVMRLVIDGRPNKLINDDLTISVHTAEMHDAHIFEMMNVRSAVELTNLLRGRGQPEHGG